MAEPNGIVDGAGPPETRASRWMGGLVGLAPFVLPTAWLAERTIRAILARVGHPGAALDDSYIHFQYARAIAEGHPFRYQAGEPFTMGATSALWPAVLAPFYALGLRGQAILWPAWVISFVSLALLSREVFLLSSGLVGRATAAGAAAMVLSLGSLTWFAASGMEVVPFAFCLARAARRASERAEGDRRAGAAELVALAWLAPLLRPEGAVASALIAATLLFFRRAPARWPTRVGLMAAALAGAVFPLVLSRALTGSFVSNTARVKLLVESPYFVGHALRAEIAKNLRVLVGTLLEGEDWSTEFLPRGGAVVALAGLVALVVRGAQRRAWWRAMCVLVLALTIAAPCSYITFLWNRLRYLWPFAPMWLVGVACLAEFVGDALGLVRPRWRAAAPLLAGAAAGALFTDVRGSIEDVAASASGIDRQQSELGRWVKETLPTDARVGVNDTGALAYFGDRRTFDIVGLTSPNEGRYWVAGPASRFEHYERMHAERPAALPTHFIVYPEWMSCDAVLGEPLREATVLDSNILGGQTMRAYEADYTLLGSGEDPAEPDPGVFDALDVADLESEAAHGYELLGAHDGEEIVVTDTPPGSDEEAPIADGGRTTRARERFDVDVPTGAPARGVVRLLGTGATSVRVLEGGEEVGSFEPDDERWGEYAFPLPKSGRQSIELVAEGGTMTVFHYWFSRAPPEEGASR